MVQPCYDCPSTTHIPCRQGDCPWGRTTRREPVAPFNVAAHNPAHKQQCDDCERLRAELRAAEALLGKAPAMEAALKAIVAWHDKHGVRNIVSVWASMGLDGEISDTMTQALKRGGQ